MVILSNNTVRNLLAAVLAAMGALRCGAGLVYVDYKLLLRKTLSEIATLSRTYRDFENSIRRIGITSDELHEIGIHYIVTHEHDLGTSFLFYTHEDKNPH